MNMVWPYSPCVITFSPGRKRFWNESDATCRSASSGTVWKNGICERSCSNCAIYCDLFVTSSTAVTRGGFGRLRLFRVAEQAIVVAVAEGELAIVALPHTRLVHRARAEQIH